MAEDGDHCKDHACKIAVRVAHEYLCRVPVVH